jgi:2,3-diaminopropionate biosynthesis protein SbnB
MMPKGQRFHVIGGRVIRALLREHQHEVVTLVRETYRRHHTGATLNPDSYFLRFPDKPTSRIIALPARVRAEDDVAGIKWIASFPENHARGLQRASATIVLNDMATGFPYACLEGSEISAARTAASAALAAEMLHCGKKADTAAVIGTGPIAATIVDYLLNTGWVIGRFRVCDLVAARAEAFAGQLRERRSPADIANSAEGAIAGADLVVFATTAGKPHLDDPALLSPAQTILHVSLRDLGVPIILSAQNVVDDVEHCLKAQTSLHLAEQQTGGRTFVAGTIGDMITGRLLPERDRVRIFSPFGLGVLDIALARFIYEQAIADGTAVAIEDFFPSA